MNMSPELKNWTYVATNTDKTVSNDFLSVLESKVDVSFNQITSISELFPLLSNPRFDTDYISIDIDVLKNFVVNNKIDEYSIINTLSTLVHSTLYRNLDGKAIHRNIKIGITVGHEVDYDFYKEVLSIPEIKFITLRPAITSAYTIFDVQESIESIIDDSKITKKIQTIINTNKSKNKTKITKNHIIITTRQQQILNLVTERAVSNKIIAKTLGISESTVKLHISTLLKKYGVRNRTQLALFSKREIHDSSIT